MEERERRRRLMHRHQYLGFRAIVGESMRSVAALGQQWVAPLAWGAAALKSRHRDGWIGWSEEIKWRRMHLPANKLRFLILPGVGIDNLASRILGANLRRLSRDRQRRHGHPILVAETFVDRARLAGTCYRAAGWIALGATRRLARRASG